MRRSLRVPVALLAAVVVAEAGVVLLRPDNPSQAPAVDPETYFSSQQLERAESYREDRLSLRGLRLVVEAGVLVALVARPPVRLVRLAPRPAVAGAITGAAISLTLAVATLPVSIAGRERAREVGLVTQGWAGYAGDVAKSEAIGALVAAAGGALFVVAVRRLGRHWWAAAAAGVVAYGVAVAYLAPVVLDPLFNDFRRLPAGELRSDVMAMAERSRVDVGEVYVVDASRRTTAANAYVTGLGATKRVVLYDNLLREFPPDEVRVIVAHELAHVRHGDVRNALVYLALVAPAGMLAVAIVARDLGARRRAEGGGGGQNALALPAVALSIMLVATPVAMVSTQLSRAVERRADAYALDLAQDPAAMISMQQRIAARNVADPDPPAWVSSLLSTHPPTIERIAQAEARRS